MFLKDKNNFTVSKADALTTARTINGTSFNGSANITTANWGTARTLSWTGDVTGSMSVNGSGNVSAALTLANSGATAGSYGQSANATLGFGGTFLIPQVTVDAKGRVTSITNRTMTMPSNPNSDTKVTNTLGTTTKAYVTGTTSASTNTGTQIFDTGVYLDTTAGMLTATTFKGALSGNATTATTATTANNVKITTDTSNKLYLTGATAQSATSSTVRASSPYMAGGTITATTFSGALSGNATTATTLKTARTINGTSFNGSANITTANWGTARTITIGNTGKSVNGSGNVAWSLSEIGAAAASHTHSYLPLSGGTLTGRLTANGKISMPTTGSSWVSGMTLTNAPLAVTTQQTAEAYHPILAVKTSGGHVANLGGLGNSVGFYGFYNGRTANGTDWQFTFNTNNGTLYQQKDFTCGSTTYLEGGAVLNNNKSLYGKNTSGNPINICGIDTSNNIYLGWGNETYINVNNTMRTSRDIHVQNGASLNVTGRTILHRTADHVSTLLVKTSGDNNGVGDGETHLAYYDASAGGYCHYFRGGGQMYVANKGSLIVSQPWIKMGGYWLTIAPSAPSASYGDIWIQNS